MALYTSIQSGNWNDPNTWGGGGWPGGTTETSDTFLISSGHTVILNITSFVGTAQVNGGQIDPGGTLYVAAKFNAANDFYNGAWIVYGAIEFKNDEPGIYELRICRNSTMTIKDGGKIEAVSNNFSNKVYHRINFDQEAISNSTNLIVESGGTVNLQGWTKTQKTYLTSTMPSGTKTLVIADDTGWEVGDQIALVKGASSVSKTLASKNSHLSWELNSTVSTEFVEDTIIYNLSKSVTFGNISNQSRTARIHVDPGANATIQNVCLYGGSLSQLKEIGTYDSITLYGVYSTVYTSTTAGITLSNIFHYCWGVNGDAFILNSDSYLVKNCDILNASTDARNQGILSYNSGGTLRNIWVDAGGGCVFDRICHLDWVGGGICNSTSTSAITTSYGGTYHLSNLIFGKTERGLSFPNTIDCTPNSGLWIFDDCLFSASITEIATPTTGLYGVTSINHNKISGERTELQEYGVLTTDSIESRSGKCYKIDPSSTTQPFILRINFPILSGKTPQLKFWAKGGGTLGNLEVEMGVHNAGITGIKASSGSLDADKRFTTTGSYQQFTVDFDGVSSTSGEVEVRILVCDDTSGIFYIDDITVSGNLT